MDQQGIAEREQIRMGDDANYLITHPIMVYAFRKVREGLIDAMSSSPMGDERTHNRLVIALQLLTQVEKNIKDVATTGKLAKLQVNKGGLFNLMKG